MLDGQCSFNDVLNEELDIFWGAYLGMEEEILLSGKLSEIAGRIEEVRHEKRQRNGWIWILICLANQAGPLKLDYLALTLLRHSGASHYCGLTCCRAVLKSRNMFCRAV